MLRRPISQMRAHLNGISHQFINYIDTESISMNRINEGRNFLHHYLIQRFGRYLSVVVFLFLLSIISIFTILLDNKSYPYRNIEELLKSNHTINSISTDINTYNNITNDILFNTTILQLNITSIQPIQLPNDNIAEMSFVAVAFFTLMTTWAIVQTLRIMRNISFPLRQRQGLSLNDIISNTDRNSLLLDPNFQRRLRMTLMRREFTGNDYELLQELDEDNAFGGIRSNNNRGAQQEYINRLPSHVFSQSENVSTNESMTRNCSICLGPFEDGDTLRTLFCLHQFHRHCVDNWLRQNASCPICKASILE